MNTILVLENPSSWKLNIPGADIVKANDYLTDESFSYLKNVKVLNLCKSYKYQSIGYYVSLIAAARGHYPIPSVKATQDLKQSIIIKRASHDLDAQIQKSLKRVHGETFELNIYFGKNIAKSHNRLANMIYNVFPLPFFKANFLKVKNKWQLDSISLIAIKDIYESHIDFAVQRIIDYVGRKSARDSRGKKIYKYEMAILRTLSDPNPPSDNDAIEKFLESADRNGVGVEIISKDDIAQLDRFDALFIRDTTAVNHYTYRFARRAESSGLVVIDDPLSILRCTNKIYLTEVMHKNKVPTPPTIIISHGNVKKVEKEIGFPCVLKVPDSSFSLGVFKYETKNELEKALPELFKKSALLLVQAFTPTEFDWRIGVLNSQPIFVCRYHMAREHWQIYNHNGSGAPEFGNVDTLSIADTPKKVISAALKATSLIGNGLYGVDLKVINGKPSIIEINDNPSIEESVEDRILGNKLYDIIIKEFIRRLDLLHGKK